MKLRTALIFFLLMAPVGTIFPKPDNILEYPVSAQQYAIVVARENDMSRAQAKQIALKRAEEVAQERGHKSFVIVSEKDVRVAKSSSDKKNMPGNMYQELIIERDFSRSQLERQDMPNASTYPAYRLVIRFKD